MARTVNLPRWLLTMIDVYRCAFTGNPVGTDTWREGYPCVCKECQEYIKRWEICPMKMVCNGLLGKPEKWPRCGSCPEKK